RNSIGAPSSHVPLKIHLPKILFLSTKLALSKVSSSQLPYRGSFEALGFGCGESPRRHRAYPRSIHGKQLALSTTVPDRGCSRTALPCTESGTWICLRVWLRLVTLCCLCLMTGLRLKAPGCEDMSVLAFVISWRAGTSLFIAIVIR
ncbi:hypothetical protein P691DRAFT_138146, partial [Macrolepiota fuliginosa MF-IS2]